MHQTAAGKQRKYAFTSEEALNAIGLVLTTKSSDSRASTYDRLLECISDDAYRALRVEGLKLLDNPGDEQREKITREQAKQSRVTLIAESMRNHPLSVLDELHGRGAITVESLNRIIDEVIRAGGEK